MTPTTRALETHWQSVRCLHRLPDTREARLAFYAGARCALGEVAAMAEGSFLVADMEAGLLRLNEGLKAFGGAALWVEECTE